MFEWIVFRTRMKYNQLPIQLGTYKFYNKLIFYKVNIHVAYHHHLFWKPPFLPCLARVRHLLQYEVSSLNTVHSGWKPSNWMSSFTHSLHVFLPLTFSPTTSKFLQADTQSSPLLHSIRPNHLNLTSQTTWATLKIPTKLYKTSLRSPSLGILKQILVVGSSSCY